MGGSADLQTEGYEKHDGEKTVQKNLYWQTNSEKGVYAAALNEYWMSMTEYRIQKDTDLGGCGIATVSWLEQLSLGSREDY